jgi:hypothetical protein
MKARQEGRKDVVAQDGVVVPCVFRFDAAWSHAD